MLKALQVPFRRDGFLPALPPPLNRWTKVRPFPAFAGTFRAWWKARGDSKFEMRNSKFEIPRPQSTIRNPQSDARPAILPPRQPAAPSAEIDKLLAEINALAGVARRVSESEIEGALSELVEKEEIKKATLWATPDLAQWKIVEQLRALSVEIISATADKHAMAQADLGITGADFALPETGTLGLLSAPEKPRAVSLLPRVHLVIMRAAALCADLHQVFEVAKKHNYLIFITGPSRTADIELTLTLGVHGPRALYVWVVE